MEISFDPTKPTLESDTREQRFWKRSVQRYDERSIVRNAIRRTVTRYVTGCSTRSRVKINADLCPNPLHRGNVNILVAIVYIYIHSYRPIICDFPRWKSRYGYKIVYILLIVTERFSIQSGLGYFNPLHSRSFSFGHINNFK